MLNNNHIRQTQTILLLRRVVVYLIVLEYLRRKMILEAIGDLKTELFKDSAEAVIPASFPPASYTYNAIGNITTKVSGPTTLGYTYHPTKKHAVNSISVNGTPYSFDYDNNGNMTSGYDLTNPASIVPRSMIWNADNMPTVVTRNGISTTLAYDGEGSRVKKVGPSGTTYYIGDHYEVSNNDPTKYIFAGNLRIAKVAASGIYYFHKDHLGSSSAMTTVLGSIQEETNYTPFGEQREHTGLTLTNYKFTDQELDPETGLYNYGARLYDAVTGRFISADTIVPDYANPQSLNRYSYTLNNPLIYVDPSGNEYTSADAMADYFGYYEGDYGSASQYSSFSSAVYQGINYVTSYVTNYLTFGLWDSAQASFSSGNYAAGLSYAVSGIALGVVNVATLGGEGAIAQLTKALPTLNIGKGVGGILANEVGGIGGAARGAAADEAFHYTFSNAVSSIEKLGLKAGSYATPNGTLSSLQAQIDLALAPNRGMRDALLRIDLAGLRQAGYEIPEITKVGRNFGMPGGGFEMQFQYVIPSQFLKVILP